MKVRLSSTEFLHHAYDMVGQTFPKGEIGEVLGQNRQNLVVCFSEESWEVSPDKLRPLEEGRRATQEARLTASFLLADPSCRSSEFLYTANC